MTKRDTRGCEEIPRPSPFSLSFSLPLSLSLSLSLATHQRYPGLVNPKTCSLAACIAQHDNFILSGSSTSTTTSGTEASGSTWTTPQQRDSGTGRRGDGRTAKTSLNALPNCQPAFPQHGLPWGTVDVGWWTWDGSTMLIWKPNLFNDQSERQNSQSYTSPTNQESHRIVCSSRNLVFQP